MSEKQAICMQMEEEELCTIEMDEVDCSESCHHIGMLEAANLGLLEDIQELKHINLIRDGLYKKALKVYGIETQINMVFEEMSELQKGLCKYLRGKEPIVQKLRIAEELADVEIMLEQMKYILGLEKAVHNHKEYKIFRLKQRLDKEEGHE